MIEAPQAPPPPPPPEPQIIERRTEIILNPAPEEPHEVPRSVREWDMMSGAGAKSERRDSSPSGKSMKSTKTSKSKKSHKSHSTHKSQHRSHRSHRSHHKSKASSSSSSSSSSSGSDSEETERGGSNTMHNGPLALVIPQRGRRKSQSISAEIKALEAEKRALKYEREHQSHSHHREGEIIIERERDVVKVEKDKKGRLSLVR